MTINIVQGDARKLDGVADGSVALICTSPPYPGQRLYEDDGKPIAGQIGAESHPQEYLENLWACCKEWWRVLDDRGSLFVNLGDKRAASGAPGTTSGLGSKPQGKRTGIDSGYSRSYFGRPKSRQMIPERFAIGCEDGRADPEGIGWIMRQVIVWCLSGGTRVYARTPTGDRPIMLRDLYRAYRPENVQLWNGQRWTQVQGWSQTPTPGDALELELRSGQRIGCTRNHQWPTARGLVRTDELTIGDVIDSTRLPQPSAASRANRWIDRPRVGWFVGMYLAEGSRSETTIQIAGHAKETERGDWLKLIAREFDGTYHRYQSGPNKVTDNLHGPILSGILDNFVSGRNAHDKRLTMRVWQQSDEFLDDLLMGYLEGDGHYEAKNDRWRLGFCENDELAADLRTLCARLGVSLRLKRCQVQGFGKWYPSWRGSLRMTRSVHWNARPDTEVIAIRASRARYFYDVGVADDPHVFALACGVLTHNCKANGLPESVTDRSRDDYEMIYHLVKSERYYSAVDELREPHAEPQRPEARTWGELKANGAPGRWGSQVAQAGCAALAQNPLGRLPGSVWRIATEPLSIPEWAKAKYNLPSHFAAFPSEIPRRLILGWSPPAICLTCGEGRWPVVEKRGAPNTKMAAGWIRRASAVGGGQPSQSDVTATILGYACACTPTHIETETTLTHEAEECDGTILVPTGVVDIWGDDRLEQRPCTDPTHMTETTKHVTVYDLAGWTPPPDRPALILDPFCGTGTTVLTAQALDRDALGVDLSSDYVRLAKWRCSQPSQAAKAKARTWGEAQGSLAL